MQHLIAHFLFQNKYCTIPKLGTLYLKDTAANAVFGEQKIIAPTPNITFSHIANNNLSFQEFIASQNKISSTDALKLIKDYSDEVNNLQLGKGIEIQNIGKFYKNEESIIAFVPLELPSMYMPDIQAERVIHPNDSHAMLVGETETNTSAMAEYLEEEESSQKKEKWWKFALAIFLLSVSSIIYDIVEEKKGFIFGISKRVFPTAADSTYKTLP